MKERGERERRKKERWSGGMTTQDHDNKAK